MFVEKVKSEGLAHLSYLLGDGGVAAVIDPRRDWEVYVARARERGCRIAHVFETHRNEDLVSGAAALARATGAAVHHGPDPAGKVVYADTVREGDRFRLGALEIRVLETPGHTDDSLSYAIADGSFGEDAVGVFTGDALFIGDVGRTDFYPERAEEVAGLLYDSLRKILALGDQAIVYPAHGAGSVCGNAMADREFSTLGYERANNPRLRIADRRAFIEAKRAEHHEQPPYFRRMERMNLEGASAAMSAPTPLAAGELGALEGATLVDVRSVAAYLGAHLPGSLCLPEGMVPAFAGWLLEPEEELVLVAEDAGQAERATRHLFRIGYDRVAGFLTTALPGWAASGRPFRSLAVVDTAEVARRVADPPSRWSLLDVRSRSEVAAGTIDGALPVYAGRISEEIGRLDASASYTVFCGSGARASVAASVLERAGFGALDVYLGSMGAWKTAGHSVVESAAEEGG